MSHAAAAPNHQNHLELPNDRPDWPRRYRPHRHAAGAFAQTAPPPRVLALKTKVGTGGTLDSFDLDFLHEVFADANSLKPL